MDARSGLFSFGVLTYEMLTGRSPFRGDNALDTLRRLAAEEPPPVTQVRPEVPARLSDLIERLLEKDPDDRPGSAAEVAAALGEIQTGASDHRPSVPPRSRRVAVAALLTVVTALSGTAWVLLHPRAEPLRVAVPDPIVKGANPRLGLAASGILSSALSGLTSIAGIAPLESRQGTGKEGSAVDMAKAAAADEILITMLEGAGNRGRVTLRRVYGDLSRAERLYLELIAKSPSGQGYFVNLGFTRALLGRHEEAIEAYSQALAIDPDQVYANLNLADSKLALGKAKEAEVLREGPAAVGPEQASGGSPPDVDMIEAQCLARLRRTREAVDITRASLRQSPDDPDVLQSAALVYILAGDGASARGRRSKKGCSRDSSIPLSSASSGAIPSSGLFWPDLPKAPAAGDPRELSRFSGRPGPGRVPAFYPRAYSTALQA